MQKEMNIHFAYFGTSHFSVMVLDELKKHGYIPSLIITTPDKPQGRKLILTPSPVKIWADEHTIPIIQPDKIRDQHFIDQIKKELWDLFIVASYGKIIPAEILDIPQHKTLNVHPSLLPKFRGPSPIQSSILADEKETGVTIMRLDQEMDHGPIIGQKKVVIDEWPTSFELKEILGRLGGALLAEIIPSWIRGNIKEQEQNHSDATYTKKIDRKDGLINLTEDAYQNYRKIQAYYDWPHAYFFIEKKGQRIRIIIKKAEYKNGVLKIVRIIPEGKKEMNYDDFMRSLNQVP